MTAENLTYLGVVNEVLKGIRENTTSSISSTRTRATQVYQAVKDVHAEVCSMEDGQWKFLESSGTLTLAESDRDYSLASDLKSIDTRSVIIENALECKYLDYQQFLSEYKDITLEGTPYNFTLWNDELLLGYVPDSNYDTKTLRYNYWKNPDDLTDDADYPVIPKEFRRRVLVFGAIAEIFATDNDATAGTFFERYNAGLADLKRQYKSVQLNKLRMTTVF